MNAYFRWLKPAKSEQSNDKDAEYAYLAIIENLEELTQLFFEPTKESSLDFYRQKITAPVFSSVLKDDVAPPTQALQRLTIP